MVFKMIIDDSLDYEEYKKICDTIKSIGYEIKLGSNGSTLFTKNLDLSTSKNEDVKVEETPEKPTIDLEFL